MQQQMVLPEGGLASFLTSNLNEIDDSRLAFGRQSGINSMRETAERMAQKGRGGDSFVVHASDREVMVPREVAEKNPELMAQVGQAISAEGADPRAYVVGNEENSVNPYTGQREFFLKKFVSKVKNVVKKLAPIIVPLALNFIAPGLGSVASGFIGGGITGLIQGRSFKDSMKMGLIGGAMGGLAKGISNLAQSKPLTSGFFDAGGKLNAAGKPYGRFEVNDKIKNFGTQSLDPNADNFLTKSKNFLMPKPNPSVGEIATAAGDITTKFPEIGAEKAFELAQKELTPNLMQKYGGTAVGLGTLAYAGGAFDPIEPAKVEDPYSQPSYSEKRLEEDPDKYTVGSAGMPSYVTLADTIVNSPRRFNPFDYAPVAQAAGGGEMTTNFPRRTGYISGPGTETSDSVPAMLSDGEFVMNARAVRGLGGGSREKGVRKMYDMMRAFEGGAVYG
tara:strand:+ start:2268 stop:3608 length:1341 start_codon:yes stop_codon:yes gene_type:complete